ncbi:hypothetical protein AVEN_253932-1 [Araneus ventricosus]|uniref:Uncharacterized protein n=1 Tax=Araneus ventricosus TaxID=182803 RepID=A0A4Y1ZL26_ARAVE|nr:hypothetical protein AVEN_253932-1 [Araneus ventricosus]
MVFTETRGRQEHIIFPAEYEVVKDPKTQSLHHPSPPSVIMMRAGILEGGRDIIIATPGLTRTHRRNGVNRGQTRPLGAQTEMMTSDDSGEVWRLWFLTVP